MIESDPVQKDEFKHFCKPALSHSHPLQSPSSPSTTTTHHPPPLLSHSQGSNFLLITLPSEVWFHVATFFNARDMLNVSGLSRAWRCLSLDDVLWKALYERRFGKLTQILIPPLLSWKDFYAAHKIYKGGWDTACMGRMLVTRERHTVSHGGDFLGSYQCVRGAIPVSSGICYWEISIDRLCIHQTGFHVVIGAIPSSFNYWHTYLSCNGGWGYLADGRKSHNSGNGEAYGSKYVEGDIIGVLVDMNAHSITFFRNGVSQGVAFNNVYGVVYPGVSLLTGGQRVSMVKVENLKFPYRSK
eukprot:TRINITY_DN4890_c0_g1_i1.p1 TRINITY_DN4890_c0_g1~~TRINITY_DN4890_c0_g1_i1.p1  ORF type:complete len:310 (+),score=54.09 TRINITY_DN4890_c0_g1_i1:35-931(+)